ncbi:hypothetical protein AB0L63_10535 [Nocardia sp. NPDC051990]|uniref:hypothetical protein n=1 Tax=Nocardia sp. NPDC051990 TaxID=3155285 RepID=UPI0034225845
MNTNHRYDDNVIDLHARRRCQLQARGLDPVTVAVHLLAETGAIPAWGTDDYDGGDWVA